MRIVYVLTSLGIGGAERQAVTLAARMQQRGNLVGLLVLGPREAEEWPTALPTAYLSLRKAPAGMLSGMLRADHFLRRFRPELLHSHGFHGNIAARLLKLVFPQVAVVSTLHNIYEGGAVRMQVYRWTDGLSRRTVAVSEAVRDRFTAMGAVAAKRCCVVPNAVEESELIPDSEQRAAMRARMAVGSEFVWLTAGRLAPGKDYPNLLRAFARVRTLHADAQLWIAGRDPYGARAALEGLTAELKLEGGVRWLGHRSDLPMLLGAADGFVLASAWEGMPVALAESMAMAKPTVATGVGGVPELLGDCGRLVAARNPGALADAMLEIMASREERMRLGCAARERILAGFTMRARAMEWERLYREVLIPCSPN